MVNPYVLHTVRISQGVSEPILRQLANWNSYILPHQKQVKTVQMFF